MNRVSLKTEICFPSRIVQLDPYWTDEKKGYFSTSHPESSGMKLVQYFREKAGMKLMESSWNDSSPKTTADISNAILEDIIPYAALFIKDVVIEVHDTSEVCDGRVFFVPLGDKK